MTIKSCHGIKSWTSEEEISKGETMLEFQINWSGKHRVLVSSQTNSMPTSVNEDWTSADVEWATLPENNATDWESANVDWASANVDWVSVDVLLSKSAN
jgi:hypothetical protein